MIQEQIILIQDKTKVYELEKYLSDIQYKHIKKILYYVQENRSYPCSVHIRNGLAPMYSVANSTMYNQSVDSAKKNNIKIVKL